MKNLLLTLGFLLVTGFVFSQTTNTDTTKSTTTTKTKLVTKRVVVVPLKKANDLNKTDAKTDTKSSGKKEDDGTQPK